MFRQWLNQIYIVLAVLIIYPPDYKAWLYINAFTVLASQLILTIHVEITEWVDSASEM